MQSNHASLALEIVNRVLGFTTLSTLVPAPDLPKSLNSKLGNIVPGVLTPVLAKQDSFQAARAARKDLPRQSVNPATIHFAPCARPGEILACETVDPVRTGT